jgi:hypothetical protein
MTHPSRRLGRRLAVILLLTSVLGIAAPARTEEGPSGLLIPPDIENVVSLLGEENTLRAIVQRQEVFVFLIVESFERGGEGVPARLLWRSEFSKFDGSGDFNPDLIEDLAWYVDELHFTITWSEGKKIIDQKCRLKAMPDARPVCK